MKGGNGHIKDICREEGLTKPKLEDLERRTLSQRCDNVFSMRKGVQIRNSKPVHRRILKEKLNWFK